MRVVMLSTDRTILSPTSPAAMRMRAYGALFDSLTVIVAGTGASQQIELAPNVEVRYPGGLSKPINALRILFIARRIPADVLSAQDPFWTGVIGLCAFKPLQIQVHTDTWGVIGTILARFTLPRARRIRVVSERIRARVAQVTSRPIDVIPIFVDPVRFSELLPKPAEFGPHPRILVVSRLAPEKRVDLAIRAIVHVPDAHLYIVGDGLLKASLQSLAAAIGVADRTHFIGWRDDVRPYYQHASCFACTSQFEGYGMALVEAVLSGCSVVTTDVGVARDLPSGLCTVVPGDVNAFAGALRVQIQLETTIRTHGALEMRARMGSYDEYLSRYAQALRETCART